MKKLVLMATAVFLVACQSTPTPTPRHVPEVVLGEPMRLSIAAYRASCNTDKPMQCLVVDSDSGEHFGLPYNAIDGFEPRVGVAYRLTARPQLDKATGKPLGGWVLDEILSQNTPTP